MFAKPHENFTLESVLKFGQAEEIGKLNRSDSKAFWSVAVVSWYERQQKKEHGQFERVLKVYLSLRGKHKTGKEHCKELLATELILFAANNTIQTVHSLL